MELMTKRGDMVRAFDGWIDKADECILDQLKTVEGVIR